MANLTLTVDADLIRRARVRAIQEGTSLSAKDREAAALQLLRLMDATTASQPADGVAPAGPAAARG